MKPTRSLAFAFVVVCSLAACGGGDDDSTNPPDAHAGAIDAPAGSVTLTVKNYLSWCSVTVNGGTAASTATQTVTLDGAGTVDLSAVALSGFQLGTTPWHDTDGDTGSGEQGTVTGTGQTASSATTETVGDTDDCVWVCCEFSGGGGCPATDQCP
jgi:hypothetical protein